MKIKFVLIYVILQFSTLTHAGKLNCFGFKNDHYIKVEVWYPGITSLDSTTGKVYIDESEMTRFESGEVNVSLLRRSFKGKNQRGDIIEGKINNLQKREGIIYQLNIPNYRMSFQNFPVKC